MGKKTIVFLCSAVLLICTLATYKARLGHYLDLNKEKEDFLLFNNQFLSIICKTVFTLSVKTPLHVQIGFYFLV